MRHGFSLVELSIVLVILGLLTGGILAGKSLIRASELRAAGTEYQRYITASQAFRDKYFYLAGDLPNATAIWGAAHATPATCVTTIGTGTQTCNGNGDGQILSSSGSNELFRFWQQLANAGLLEGTYTGTEGALGGYDAVIGTNVPASKLPNAGWTTFWIGTNPGGTWFNGDYGNFLALGKDGTFYTIGSVFTPEELWNIDTKLDDGMPATGKVFSYPRTSCTNASSSADTAATYTLTATTAVCAMIARQAFF